MAAYHLIKKVKSSKFNVDYLSQYNLCFLLGKQHFTFCIIDSKSNYCLLLEDYLLNTDDANSTLDTLKSLFESHHLLNAGFWNAVKIAFYSEQSVLVPETLFDRNNLKEYLLLNAHRSYEDSLQLCYYKHHQKMVTVFAVDQQIVQWFQGIYPNLNLHLLHHSSALIEGIPRQEGQSPLKSMALFIKNQVVDILVFDGGQLHYCNQFEFDSPLEFINYVMVVMQELQLDPNMARVDLWGDINPQSDYFKILYKYIRNIAVGKRPSNLNFTFEFDELDEQQYFDVFGLFYCD